MSRASLTAPWWRRVAVPGMAGWCALGVLSIPCAWAGPFGLPVPPHTQLTAVGEGMQINGLPVSAYALHSDAPVEQVVAFYQALWASSEQDEQPQDGYQLDRVGELQVISQLQGRVNTVVQVSPGPQGGSSGFVSQVDLSASLSNDSIMHSVSLPPGGELISFTQSIDGDQAGATWLAAFSGHRDSASRFFEDEMLRDGWQLANRWQGEDHTVLMFDGKNARLDIVIGGDLEGDTLIAINRSGVR